MPTVTNVFNAPQLFWNGALAGNPGGVGTQRGNIDTSTFTTEQIRSGTFTIGDLPPNATNSTWDTVSFDVAWTHINRTNSGAADQDIGRFAVFLRNSAGNVVASQAFTVAPEDGPTTTASGANGVVNAQFSNIAPGTYFLSIGEINTGDGEALFVTAYNGTAIEEVPCFAAGTLIETNTGMMPVEALKAGDLVRTCDNGLRPLRWVGTRNLDSISLANQPKLRPIRIKAGALGEDLPSSDLIVSPQHRMLVRSTIAQRMFGAADVLIAAKKLLDLDGVDVAHDIAEVDYIHLMFDQHEIVFANGSMSESFYTGPQALKAIGPSAREELFALFPALETESDQGNIPASVRHIATGKMARNLVSRHAKHSKPLVS